jgi:small-conductance mechanosensitive channel
MLSSEIQKTVGWVPDWLIAAVVLVLTAAVASAVFGGVRLILRRAMRGQRTLSHSVLEHAGGFAQFALTLLAAEIVTPLLPLEPDTTDVIKRLLLAAFVVLTGWVVILANDLAINRYIGRFRTDTEDNLLARKAITQMRVLKRTIDVGIGIITAGFALMTFDAVRQFGISLFASAGVAGLAIGLAAKPLLTNLVAGVQLAITQPIRIDDAVVIDNEWGWIEEITSTYVVVRLWDWRRLVVPLSYFMENAFQNWTRTSSALIGSVMFYLDYTADIGRIRTKFEEVARASKLWDGNVLNMQVTDVTERTIQVRAIVSARNSGQNWDLRCEVREKVLAFLQNEYPEALPRWRAEITDLPQSVPQRFQAAARHQ